MSGVPKFVIVQRIMPYGARLAKRKLWVPMDDYAPLARGKEEYCHKCKSQILGVLHYLGHIQNKPIYSCHACWKGNREDTLAAKGSSYVATSSQGGVKPIPLPGMVHGAQVERWCRKCGMFLDNPYHLNKCVAKEQKAEAAVSHKGNLREEEYRFWVGVIFPEFSQFGMCRCCGHNTYSEAERDEHKHIYDAANQAYLATKEYGKIRDNCNVTLRAAYAELLKKGRCVVCRGDCGRKSRWGVPLCSLACITEWKFAQRKYIPLELALRQVAKNGGSNTSEST